ncbi:adipocyte plasma membrane-associated protein Hemomucin-like [Battus philenor]|uniref:adipocyte plasma membrane-associated protein Hemomucin-like n=1 Tax=Battus philenor TaxID=42288 RepID=UPI0035D0A452
MGFLIGLLKRILKLLFYFVIFITAVILIPNLPPYTEFTEIKIEDTRPRIGVLSPNGALNNAQKLFNNKLIGPEAFQIYNDELYTGLATGEIVKISPGGHVTFVTKIGQPCTGLTQEHICGRPLGFEIDGKNKLLYVADAYHGIWKVDFKTDKKQLLVSPNIKIDGKQPKIFNGITLDKSGDLYWTHSSTDYDLSNGAMVPLSDPSGRLLYYNSKTNQSKVLLDNLWFANGVVISPNNQFVLVAESNKHRLLKYYINGPNKGKSEVFVAGLPGVPDNLRVLPDGSGVLAMLYVAYDEQNPLITYSLARTPMARKFLARLSLLIEKPFELLNEHFPHVILENIIYKIGHISSLDAIIPQISGIIQLDWNGNIVASYFNTDKSIGTASDAIVYNEKLYIGNPHSSYLALTSVPPLIEKAFRNSEKVSSSAFEKEELKKIKKGKVESVPVVDKAKNSENDKIKIVKTKETSESIPEKNSDLKAQKVIETPKEKQHSKVETVTKPKVKDINPNKKEAVSKEKAVENESVEQKTASKPLTVDKVNKATPIVKSSGTKQVEESKIKVPHIEKKQGKESTIKASQVEKKSADPPILTKGNSNVKKSEETRKVDKEDVLKTPQVKQRDPELKSSESKKQTTIDKNESHSKTKTLKSPQSVRDQIPVKEDIPSDRVKPSKETLKVIKKSGPVEIPNPN